MLRSESTTTARSLSARAVHALVAAIVMLVLTPACALLLGIADAAKSHPFVWLIPVATGGIVVFMGLVGGWQAISHRRRGLLLSALAVLLGICTIGLGWYALFFGEVIHNGPMW